MAISLRQTYSAAVPASSSRVGGGDVVPAPYRLWQSRLGTVLAEFHKNRYKLDLSCLEARMAQLDQLTDDSKVLPKRGGGNVEGNAASRPEDDGSEFSSSPMPAAYGVFYSAAIGLLTLVILLAIFRAIF
jgi:hypothetical protein